MIKRLLYRRRIEKAVSRWNDDVVLINAIAQQSKDGLFVWGQLVWQEIEMFCKIGDVVTQNELEWLCQRRGFDDTVFAYLAQTLNSIGLGKNLLAKVKASKNV